MSKVAIENIRISFTSIKNHLLRTILTVAIIAFGIMALVGILTAIDSLTYYLTENFSMMGSNTFNLRNREMVVQMGGDRSSAKSYEAISYREALKFKELYTFPASTSIYTWGTALPH